MENMNFNKNAEIRISVNGLISVAALFALYGVSCLVPAGAQIYNSDFMGIAALLLCSLSISGIWLAIYWFLDRLQRENTSAVVLTFLCSLSFYIVFQTVFSWLAGSNYTGAFQKEIVPLAAFYAVFSFYTIRLKTFDELVDSFIYGAFSGTGIAFASCMMEFVAYDSVSVKFIMLELVTRISVYSAIFSLSGFLLHRALLKNSAKRVAVAIAAMILLLGLNAYIESVISKNLVYASARVIPVLVSFFFVLVEVVVVVSLIHRAIKMEESLQAPVDNSFIKTPKKSAAILFALAAICALCVRAALFETKKFTVYDEQYSFRLPYGYEKRIESSENSIFTVSESNNNEYFSNGSENIYFYFDIDRSSLQSFGEPSYYLHKWGIIEEKHVYASQENGETSVVFQTAFLFRKGKKSFVVDAYSSAQDDSDIRKAVRMIAKSLEENDD